MILRICQPSQNHKNIYESTMTGKRARQDSPSPHRRLSSVLAWGTFAWFASEPDNIVIFKDRLDKHGKMLYELL